MTRVQQVIACSAHVREYVYPAVFFLQTVRDIGNEVHFNAVTPCVYFMRVIVCVFVCARSCVYVMRDLLNYYVYSLICGTSSV